MMNTVLDRQIPLKKNILPWNPSNSLRNGKNFSARKPSKDNRVLQNATPKSLIFSGIISAMTVNGKLKTADDAKNIANRKLTSGIQLYSLIS